MDQDPKHMFDRTFEALVNAHVALKRSIVFLRPRISQNETEELEQLICLLEIHRRKFAGREA